MDLHVPSAAGPIRGRFRVPPSKSWVQRALVLAALADGPSVLQVEPRLSCTDLASALTQVLADDEYARR